jgi:hypothetical protein
MIVAPNNSNFRSRKRLKAHSSALSQLIETSHKMVSIHGQSPTPSLYHVTIGYSANMQLMEGFYIDKPVGGRYPLPACAKLLSDRFNGLVDGAGPSKSSIATSLATSRITSPPACCATELPYPPAQDDGQWTLRLPLKVGRSVRNVA